MISYRQADIIEKIKSKDFPNNIIGKRLIFFPAAAIAKNKMGFIILDWRGGSVYRDNPSKGSYEAHSLGHDISSDKTWSDPIYKKENFFGVRDDMAFFQNDSQAPVVGHKVEVRFSNGSSLVGVTISELTSDGYVILNNGVKIKPEDYCFASKPNEIWVLSSC